MPVTFTIPGTLPSLNDYTLANRGNRYGGAKMKRDAEACIQPYLPKPVGDLRYPVDIEVLWVEPTSRRDADNVFFGIKMILDTMVRAGLLHGDGRRYVRRISHDIITNKENPRVEVEVVER